MSEVLFILAALMVWIIGWGVFTIIKIYRDPTIKEAGRTIKQVFKDEFIEDPLTVKTRKMRERQIKEEERAREENQ